MSVIRDASFDVASTAQLVIDHGGRLTAANHLARALLALTTKDVGRPLRDLEVSYRPIDLRSRVQQVQDEHRAHHVRNVEWSDKGEQRIFDVHLIPLTGGTSDIQGVSVSFVDVTSMRDLQAELDRSTGELQTAHEELLSTVEELETTNEELQSTTKELETTNEELRSTNDELETMNEELQSSNEDVETINDELAQRTDDLDDANTFLEAVLSSLQSAVIVVDCELRVDVWNDHASDLWGLRSEEVEGEHLMNLDIGMPVEALRTTILSCLNGDAHEPEQTEVTVRGINRHGRAVEVRIRSVPLLGPGQDVLGVMLLMDTTEIDEQPDS